jgi:hypothetical protein
VSAHRLSLASLALVIAFAAAVAARVQQQRFPHEQHARLFPVCVGCHEGITSAAAEVYPDPQSCGLCHDGQRVARIEWSGPAPSESNLRFDHISHAGRIDAAGSPELDCGACHTDAGAPRMRVEPPIAGRCFECHAHPATEHIVDGDCAACHRPLVETTFAEPRIALLPVPSTHGTDGFLPAEHGALAEAAPEKCATCHAREQCIGCHVSVAAGSPVERIQSAAGRIEVPAIPARYPLPDSHRDVDWETAHGAAATPADCGTCHTRESCTGCHAGGAASVVMQLASAREAAAPGAAVVSRLPASHASAFFRTAHGSLAAARPQSCATCHDRTGFCGACHEPSGSSAVRDPETDTTPPPPDVDSRPAPAPPTGRRGGFHPPNFVLRHPAEAFGRRLDCSTCHSTQLFCRDCHQEAGLGSSGRLGPGYHDAEPVWLLRHGQAARQTLETCTSCHTQRDCMQCHSQLGAFRVNPHGPGFDARRAQRANPQICRACHLTDPLAGG